MKAFKAKAPGKLILSGEHAVVHGCPALACAINRYMICTLTPIETHAIHCHFNQKTFQTPLANIETITRDIDYHYQQYQEKKQTIDTVLSQPSDLALYVVDLFTKTYQIKLTNGFVLDFTSDLPVGCGMGASAAMITALLKTLYIAFDIPIVANIFYELALKTEHLQHGTSSGLDIYLAQKGGAFYIQQQTKKPVHLATPLPCYFVNTGKPKNSTGECVDHVKQHFQQNTALWEAFTTTTMAIEKALAQEDYQNLIQSVKKNHALLTEIGVVPQPIKNWINTIESQGFAAKISGAGSITGNKAGIVLLFGDNKNALNALCEAHHFTLETFTIETQGARSV